MLGGNWQTGLESYERIDLFQTIWRNTCQDVLVPDTRCRLLHPTPEGELVIIGDGFMYRNLSLDERTPGLITTAKILLCL
jgi:hypothetical protein